jgi:hypothetical protein
MNIQGFDTLDLLDVNLKLTAFLRTFKKVTNVTDQFDVADAAFKSLAALGQKSCDDPSAPWSAVKAEVDKLEAFAKLNPFSLSTAWFVNAVQASNAAPNIKATFNANNEQRTGLRAGLLQWTQLLKDDCEQFKAVARAIAEDTDFERICKAQKWRWDWVVRVKRAGVLFRDVITAKPRACTKLGGGTQIAPWRVEWADPSIGVRVFKENQVTCRMDLIPQYAVNGLYRSLATARYEELILSKLDPTVRQQHYPSLLGDCKLAIVQVELGFDRQVLGTAVTFFDRQSGFKPVVLNDLGPTNEDGPPTVVNVLELKVDVSDVVLRRKLLVLHELDLLCGQVDRNSSNVFVSQLPNRTTLVAGIDNDFSFCSVQTVTERMVVCAPMPPVFDKAFSEAIDLVDATELDAPLKGLFEFEIQAAKARLASFKAEYARSAPQSHLVIAAPGPNERLWTQFELTELVPTRFGAATLIERICCADPFAGHIVDRTNVVDIKGHKGIRVRADRLTTYYVISRLPDDQNGSDLR